MAGRMWMVRAGRGGVYAEGFVGHGCVAFGEEEVPNLGHVGSRDEIADRLSSAMPNLRRAQLAAAIGQCCRFILEISEGDRVITYDPERRVYLVGQVAGPCSYNPTVISGLRYVRTVKWDGEVDRDNLSAPSKNTLGSIMSVFSVGGEVALEIEALLASDGREPTSDMPEAPEVTVDELRRDSEERARGFIVDRIAGLDWQEMQDLVAGILRAMGYKTRVAKVGPDRGCDILASPDGLGLSQPRIIVEVKHRLKEASDSKVVRGFLGGRRPGDNGMFVSTGGFTKDARYEADRATIPVALIGLEELVDLLIQHYAGLDAETRALVPLVPVHWPAS